MGSVEGETRDKLRRAGADGGGHEVGDRLCTGAKRHGVVHESRVREGDERQEVCASSASRCACGLK